MIPTPLRLAFLALLFAGTALRLCAASSTITVTTTADSGPGSLRQAIIGANASPGNDIIDFNFATGTAPYTITLASALDSIATTTTAGTLTITGLGASSLTISGDNGNPSRDFRIFTIASGGNLSISGVTVSGAKTTGSSGAFLNSGTLSVTHSTISGNTAGFAGGGIRNEGGILTVSNSTISLNTSQFSAGISATGGTMSVTNSTLVGNVATASGGGIGIFNGATVTLTHSTLSGNSASSGGGIYLSSGNTLNIANTIIANSTSGGDFAGSGTVNVTSPATAAHNLVSQGTFAWATTKTSAEINLGTLANNGGTTSTLALLTGSVAIGTGNAAISNAAPVSGLDQRGTTRSATAPSIGAFEGQNPANTPTFATPTSTANGFTVQISNYDNNFTYGGTATAGGTVAISNTGLVTVSGVAPSTSSTATLTTTRTAYLSGSAQVTATTLAAPGAPTGVSAIAGNAQVTVIFTAPANNGGAAITGYTVTSSPAGGTDTNAGSTSLSHVITGLTNGTAYTFTVTATNSVGTSSASTASSAVTPATPPGAPTSVAAVRGPGEAVVSFLAPVSNGGAAITSYTVTSSPGGVTATGASSPITITGLTNGTSYTFTVTATNAVGTGSASSASNAITPTAASLAGVNFGATGGVVQVLATAVDAAGNSYIVGTFSGQTTLVLGGVTLTRLGTQDGWLAKLDASRTVVWAKNIGGSGASVNGRGIAVDSAGNVYVSGSFRNADLSTPALTKIGTQDGFAIKYNSSGTITWTQSFGGLGSTTLARGIAVDGTRNVYLSGDITGANLTTPAVSLLGTMDALAMKLNSSGTITWTKNFGGVGVSANTQGVAVDSSGNVYLSGDFMTASLTTPALTKIGSQDGLVLKLDSSGTTTWAKSFGGSGASITARGLALDSSGNSYFSGYFESGALTTPALAQIGTKDALAIKLDSSGTTTWAKSFGGAGAATTGRGIAVDSSGNVYLGGFFQTASMTTPALALTGPQDAFALKLNSSGNATWAKKFFGSGAFATNASLALDEVGNVYLGGYFATSSMTAPALTLGAIADAMLIVAYLPEPSVPGAPTGVSATAGNAQATVSFTAPTNTGGIAHTGTVAITGYTVTSSPAGGIDGNAGGTSLSRVMTGLTNGTSYTFTVTATNSVGSGSASSASAAVTPAGNPTITTPTSASVGSTSATLGGNVTASGGASLSAVGVVYAITSANSNPQLNGTGVTNVAGTAATGVFTVNATGLTAGTAYSYAAYATNSQGTTYTSVGTFTTAVPTPTLTFATPSAASVAVGATQTNAVTSTLSGGGYGAISYTSSDTGKATVNPTTGVVTGLAVGSTTITATQAAASGFNAATSTSYTLTVTIGTPTISAAPSASSLIYGQILASSTLSGGTASVAGTFAFTTPSTAPGVGTAAQGVTFTPTDATNYTSVTTTVNVTVAKATPTITVAPTASGIIYGQTLASSTLSQGTASTAGTFTFTTPSTAPNAGISEHGVTFTPSSPALFNTITTTVNVTVAKARTAVIWATPSAITYGTALSETQLNARGSVAGTIAYSPASGTTPSAGTQTLTATFTPTDTANYNASTRTVSLVVNKATPTITWATPSTITVGTALSAAQLNATASVAGAFTYSPASGTTPSVGTQTLSATFTPTDTANYNSASASVSLNVIVAVPGSPTAITATTANGEATVTFTAPSNPGSSAITGYTIRATATDGSTVTVNATGSPAKVTGLMPGKSYRFTVTANNSAGSSDTGTTSDGLTISLVNQTISFTAPADRTSNSGSFTLAATSSSGLPVTFTVVSGPALLTGNVLDLTGTAGTVKIRASQAGNATYAAAPEVEVTFAVTAGRTNVVFSQALSSGSSVPAAELGLVLPGNGQPGSLLVVSTVIPGLNGVIKVEFTVRGGFIGTLVSSVAAAPLGARIQAAPVTYTITGTLLNGVLTGTIAPLGLVFTAPVPLPTGPSAAAAGLYVTGALVQAAGTVSAVVGANNEVLVLIQSATVTTGGLTTLKPDTTFALAAPGNGVIAGAVNPVTTSATATLTLPGSAPVAFSGLSTTTKRTDRLIGLATRAKVGIGESVLIAGVAIGGTESKRVLIRAGGPALAGFGLANTLANPTLKIYRGSTLIAQNDDWSPADAAETARLGLFAFPNGSKDAAILTTLEPGTYTAQVSDLSGTGTGVALAEIYDASVNPTAEYQRLVSIASRGTVTVGDGALIGGFVVVGNAPKTLLIRGIGPTLTRFGLVGVLADPVLTIYDGGEALATNAGWANSAAIATAATEAGAFALAAGSRDAALLVTLKPGSYTAQVKASQVTSSGVALIEIYEVP